jgi:hypothetical protein
MAIEDASRMMEYEDASRIMEEKGRGGGGVRMMVEVNDARG